MSTLDASAVAAQRTRMQAKRAIEALRSGVPSRDAALELGSAHPAIEDQFRLQLRAARDADTSGRSPAGLLIAGDFGTGKSHLLECLHQVALQENFVSSKVIISKETPLHDPLKVFRAAIRAASVPKRVGAALNQIASELDFESERAQEFVRWSNDPASGLNARFPKTLFLFQHANHAPELLDQISSFWAGDPIQVGDIKRALTELGERPTVIETVKARDLAFQRFRFAARLMLAAGYSGWVLLFDEVDLVGRYSLGQRAKSYAEIARWTGNLANETYAGITAIVAITAAFEAEILIGKNDLDIVPGRLRASGRDADRLLAPQAERGMRLISQAIDLTHPSNAVIDATYANVRAIHGRAYSWNPPDVGESIERLTSTRMREYVRRWINEWDLTRLDPAFVADTEVTQIEHGYDDVVELQSSGEGDPERTDDTE